MFSRLFGSKKPVVTSPPPPPPTPVTRTYSQRVRNETKTMSAQQTEKNATIATLKSGETQLAAAGTAAAAASILGQVLQGAASATILTSVIAFPPALPAIAGALLVAAIILNMAIAHTELNVLLRLHVDQLSDLMSFVKLMDKVITLMLKKYPALAKYNFKSGKVIALAELYRAELIKHAPPSVINKLVETSAYNANVKKSLNNAKITQKRTRNIKGALNRFFSSPAIMNTLTRIFLNLITACGIMQQRFAFFITRYSKEFNEIMDDIETDKDPANKQLVNIVFGLETETIPLNPEGDKVDLDKTIREAEQAADPPTTAEIKLQEKGAAEDNQSSISKDPQPVAGGGYCTKTKRRRQRIGIGGRRCRV